MLATLKNLFGKSPQNNPYETVAGHTAGSLQHTRPLGLINGHVDGAGASFWVIATNWVKTLGSGTVTTADGHPATMTLVTNNVADAVTSIEISKDGGTTVWKLFQVSSTDHLWIRGRVKISDATNSAFLFGLSNTATANIFGTGGSTGAIGSGITDFIGFHKTNATTLNAVVRKASTSTSQTLSGITVADDTYLTLGIRVTSTAVEFWVNGVLIYTQTTTTNLPLTSTQLTVRASAQTPATAAKTLTAQRLVFLQEAA